MNSLKSIACLLLVPNVLNTFFMNLLAWPLGNNWIYMELSCSLVISPLGQFLTNPLYQSCSNIWIRQFYTAEFPVILLKYKSMTSFLNNHQMIQNKQGLSLAKLSQPNHLITTTYSIAPATIYTLQPPTLTGDSSNTLDLHGLEFYKKSIMHYAYQKNWLTNKIMDILSMAE